MIGQYIDAMQACNEVLADKIDAQAAEIVRLRADLAFTRGERDAGTIVATREIARVLRERDELRRRLGRILARVLRERYELRRRLGRILARADFAAPKIDDTTGAEVLRQIRELAEVLP